MGRKQAGSTTELKPVEPEPKDVPSPAPASPSASHKSKDAAADSKPDADDAAPGASSEAAAGKDKAAQGDSLAAAAPEPAQVGADEERPPPPPRPKPERRVSGFSTNLTELRAAFPETDDSVLRAVLVAASNNLEAAFTGMLAMTDATIRPAAYINEQIERDARLARRLAESQAQAGQRDRASRRGSRDPRGQRPPPPPDAPEGELAGDDLYNEFSRGFTETKQAVSSFWGSLKQRISNEVYDDDDGVGAYADDDREPARDQWWPRQTSSGRQNPPLPPRRSSTRPSSNHTAEPKGPRDAATEPKESRSVNAFGDDSTAQRKQWEPVQADAPEPDAFFIGESDDDDLGSLNEESPIPRPANAEAESESNPKTDEKSTGSKPEVTAEKSKDAKADQSAKGEDESVEGRSRRSSTAKDLLSKLSLEASEKAKAEGEKS